MSWGFWGIAFNVNDQNLSGTLFLFLKFKIKSKCSCFYTLEEIKNVTEKNGTSREQSKYSRTSPEMERSAKWATYYQVLKAPVIWAFLCGIWIFVLHLSEWAYSRFLPHSKDMHIKLTIGNKLIGSLYTWLNHLVGCRLCPEILFTKCLSLFTKCSMDTL